MKMMEKATTRSAARDRSLKDRAQEGLQSKALHGTVVPACESIAPVWKDWSLELSFAAFSRGRFNVENNHTNQRFA
jgi:hypothetical protein